MTEQDTSVSGVRALVVNTQNVFSPQGKPLKNFVVAASILSVTLAASLLLQFLPKDLPFHMSGVIMGGAITLLGAPAAAIIGYRMLVADPENESKPRTPEKASQEGWLRFLSTEQHRFLQRFLA